MAEIVEHSENQLARRSQWRRGLFLIDEGKAPDNGAPRKNGAGCQYRVGADPASVSDQRAKLVVSGVNVMPAVEADNFLVGPLVAIVGQNRAGLDVGISPNNRISD